MSEAALGRDFAEALRDGLTRAITAPTTGHSGTVRRLASVPSITTSRPHATLLPGEAELILHRFHFLLPSELDAEDRRSPEVRSALTEGARQLLADTQDNAGTSRPGSTATGGRAPSAAPWSGLRMDQIATACTLLKECALLQIVDEERDADKATLTRGFGVLRALNSAIKQRLKDQAARIDDSLRSERRRLARDLHDQLGSELAVAMRRIELHEAEAKGSQHLMAAKSSVREAMDHTRELIFNIRSHAVTPPLCEGLRAFVAKAAPTGVDIDITMTGNELIVPENDRHEIFLVVRECLRNAFAHGEANRVKVSMRVTRRWFHARVTDDGVGFPADRPGCPTPTSHGLRSMNERLEGIGGRLRIDSEPGEGTCVEIHVPLHGRA
ncbi:sensor histidine kinase [Streptomyces sp. NPDC053048]|uniref:sensor histidine kinase n=1 Tax=Streptomyces sp. NPDC053048 TaxID=3365694 RepID=UPI0037CEFC7C